MLFQTNCTNTQKVPVSFQVFTLDGSPARLDTVNSQITLEVPPGTDATAVVLPETVGPNGFPMYNIEVISGTLEEELIQGTIRADGLPGSGIAEISDVWELAVTPQAAVNFGAVTVGAPIAK